MSHLVTLGIVLFVIGGLYLVAGTVQKAKRLSAERRAAIEWPKTTRDRITYALWEATVKSSWLYGATGILMLVIGAILIVLGIV